MELKTIKIHNTPYVMVNERLKAFRNDYPNWSLESEIVQLDENSCVIRAIIRDENGLIRATGLAQEDKTSSMINQTSYVENCETSAWGRALGCLGIGIDTSVASADEMELALAKQERLASKQERLASKQELLGGEYVFKGGKHAGKAIKDTPEDYLEWYAQNGGDEFIKRNIRKFLEEKNQQIVNVIKARELQVQLPKEVEI